MTKHLSLHKVLATLLTIAALFAGQQAFATITDSITIKGKMETNGYFYQITSHWFSSTVGPEQSNSHIFNQFHFQGVYNDINFDMMLNGKIHFPSTSDYSDVMTGVGGLTVTFTSHHSTPIWFYGVAVKTLDGTDVPSGWTYSITHSNQALTITFESGITFGKIEFDYVPNAPMTSTNTTVTVPQGDYWVSDADHLPTPAPTVTYGSNNTPLTQGTDYTLSWSNNTSAGTGTVTVTGTGSYIGSVSANFNIRWANYSVRFDKNHSDATGTMDNQDFTYNTAQNLTANGFSLTDYNFAGWNTAADGTGTTYSDQQSVSNLTPVNGETVTLYAQWATTTYTISYTLKGGTVTPANPTTYTETTPDFTLNNPTRTGCIFTGWTGSNGTTPQTEVTITQGSTGNRTYTANWTPITYNITYDLDGGNATNPTSYTVETETFQLNNPTKTGYTFAGWTGSNGTTPQTTVTIIIGSTGDRNYIANWTLNTYYIFYELNGGTVTAPNPTTYTVETPTFTLNNPTKTGYFFAGWTHNNSNTLQTTVTIAQGSTGNCYYTAHWGIYTSYVDASGTLHENIPAIPLDDTKTPLAEGTYVVNSNVSFTNKTVELKGNVTLILADGYTMSITNEQATGITIKNKSLNIYGQSLGSGTLSIETRNQKYGINIEHTGAYIQHSGNVSIHSPYACINGSMSSIQPSNITLLGGTLDIKQEKYSDYYDIKAYNISILGGKFQSNGENGIAGVKITLGWTTPTDSIYANSYLKAPTSGRMTIANGQALYYENEGENVIVSGTLDDDQISAIAGKTLRPCYTKEIAGYENGNGGWAFISSPVAGSIAPTAVGNLIGGQIPESTLYDYDLYRFNQSPVVNSEGEYLEWQNYHQHTDDFNLVNGQGYLYASKDTTTLVFTGAFNMAGTQDVPLVYETTNPDTRIHGWNLVGNPFGTAATLGETPFYRMNATGTEIILSETSTVAAMEGIFVKATGLNDTVTFSKTTPSANAGNTNNAALVMNISQNRGAVIDRAIVRFGEGQRLPKFQIRDNSTKIYIPQEGTDYAVASVGNVGEIPIHFKAAENGQYTLTISSTLNYNYLHLIDNMTGADIDLLQFPLCKGGQGDSQPAYTFTARTTDYESRFKLVFSICGDANDDNEAFAFISNGNIIVNGEGTLQVIDVLGRVILSGDAIHHVSTDGFAPGVYVLRLVNGNDVKTQKMVID